MGRGLEGTMSQKGGLKWHLLQALQSSRSRVEVWEGQRPGIVRLHKEQVAVFALEVLSCLPQQLCIVGTPVAFVC